VVDTSAPVTSPSGADDLWHNTSVTVTFSATDDGSGVAYTEYSLDGGAWMRAASVTIAPPRKSSVAEAHTVAYRSADKAGNVESARTVQVKLDTKKPVTTSVTNPGAGSAAVTLTASDAGAGVAATYVSIDGGAYSTATSIVVTGAGRHTVRFYSTDKAGNAESATSTSVRVN
jgi:hypothetical protein